MKGIAALMPKPLTAYQQKGKFIDFYLSYHIDFKFGARIMKPHTIKTKERQREEIKKYRIRKFLEIKIREIKK